MDFDFQLLHPIPITSCQEEGGEEILRGSILAFQIREENHTKKKKKMISTFHTASAEKQVTGDLNLIADVLCLCNMSMYIWLDCSYEN